MPCLPSRRTGKGEGDQVGDGKSGTGPEPSCTEITFITIHSEANVAN